MQGRGTAQARLFRCGTAIAFLAGILATGCGRNEECEKVRLEASKAWQTVTAQAGEAELKGPPGFEELSEVQKAEHVKQWREIEKQSEMVSSSFTYEKITWKTADPAREKANQLFDAYSAKSEFLVFTAALKTANAKFDETAKLCKN
ncbi:MAG TPA: hypothetical protein VFZ53_04455 [Polyangiaceae bacterium]